MSRKLHHINERTVWVEDIEDNEIQTDYCTMDAKVYNVDYSAHLYVGRYSGGKVCIARRDIGSNNTFDLYFTKGCPETIKAVKELLRLVKGD